MKKTALTIAALIGLSFTGGAFAQGTDFATLDTNADGEISFEELLVVLPDLTEAEFAMLDTDGSGGLSEQEFQVLLTPPAAPAPMDAPAEVPMDAPPMEGQPMDTPIQ